MRLKAGDVWPTVTDYTFVYAGVYFGKEWRVRQRSAPLGFIDMRAVTGPMQLKIERVVKFNFLSVLNKVLT